MSWFNPFIIGGGEGGSVHIDVDTELNEQSTNPVTNSAITNAINTKLDIVAGVGEKTDGIYMENGDDSGTGGTGSERFNNYANNASIGAYSHAEGKSTVAKGEASHSEGNNTRARGQYSHVEGDTTIAGQKCAHAEGYLTTASGFNSHAEGQSTIASGTDSHAEGEGCHAEGGRSHAEGYVTIAQGQYSHAEGNSTNAIGLYSHSQNFRTIAKGQAQTAIGKLNIQDDENKYAFIIGNGTASNTQEWRSNALAIDWEGKIYTGNATEGIDINATVTNLRGLIDNKVDKVDGKQLSTEDYTTTEKTKLASLNNYDDTAIRNLINTKQNILTFDETPTQNSSNPVTSNGIFESLLPITQAEYDAINPKTKPIYFIYEEEPSLLTQAMYPNAVNDINIVENNSNFNNSLNLLSTLESSDVQEKDFIDNAEKVNNETDQDSLLVNGLKENEIQQESVYDIYDNEKVDYKNDTTLNLNEIDMDTEEGQTETIEQEEEEDDY